MSAILRSLVLLFVSCLLVCAINIRIFAKSYEKVCLEFIISNKDSFKDHLFDYKPNDKINYHYYVFANDCPLDCISYELKGPIKTSLKQEIKHYYQYKYKSKLKLKPVVGAIPSLKKNVVDFFKSNQDGLNCLIIINSKVKVNNDFYVLVWIEWGGCGHTVIIKLDDKKRIVDFDTYFGVE
jgi:hypothetical protein